MAEQQQPAAAAEDALDEHDAEPRTPMKRLGSTRKLAAFNTIRLQLAEQSRVLEARAEAAGGVAGELHEYCRRRADLEAEYARALDKLARAAAARHDAQRARRQHWELGGAHACWQAALGDARALARDHAALAALYGGALAARVARAADDAARLHRKCRALLLERHEEVAAALAAAHRAGKAHAAAHAAWRRAALKLRAAYDARNDPPTHKKIKALDKELEKRRSRHSVARAAAMRARAEHALSVEGANATLQRYYLDDVADVMLCAELGYEGAVRRVAGAAAAAEAARGAAAASAAGALAAAAAALDALADRQRVLGAHAAAFALPRPLAPPAAADAAAVDALLGEAGAAEGAPEAAARADLERRRRQLEAAAAALRAECQENAKTLDAAEDELLAQMEGNDSEWDVSGLFGAEGAGSLPPPPPPPTEDQEDYYLAKFRAYVSCAGRLARVESKAAALRGRLAGVGPAAPPAPPPARAARRARGRFAAPLELRLPRVLTECVRVIAAHGLRHQGVFRVSGSQVEMQALRAAFERGEEPLARADASDINSVCGLLKLYLRELRPPLLPPQLQERLVRVAALPDDAAFAARLRDTLLALPLPALLVLRYLFAFLAHVAEHAHHNMMDAWNLAVCLGPTLLAAWGDPPHQLAAQNLLNELVKRTILLHERVFPQDVAPHALYRRPGEEEPPPPAPAAAEEAPPDEPDSRDCLSLPDDDSDSEEEETSDDSEAAEWADADAAAADRSAVPQVNAAPAAAADPPADPADSADSTADLADPADSTAAPCRRLAESTPDLVLDLPTAAAGLEPASASAAGELAADTFAHNQDTLRKRPHRPASPAQAQAEGSPVPARNTARVAARFAELTLTGGSLKPALAAKPALLRRPTPHPHRAAAAPAPHPHPHPHPHPPAPSDV